MKLSEIVLGKTYSNGKGVHRQVIDQGEHCKLYKIVEDPDCIQFQTTRVNGRGHRLGYRGNMTRRAFASWAKELVE